MKKRLGILALAATLIVQSAAFVPTFAEDTAAEPTAAEEMVLARYESNDGSENGVGIQLWQPDKLPWRAFVSVWNNDWVVAGDGRTVGTEDGTVFKSIREGSWWQNTLGGFDWKYSIVKDGNKDNVSQGNIPMISSAQMSAGVGLPDRFRVAKGFTAPKSGIIKIGSDYDLKTEGDDNIIAGAANTNRSYITIVSSDKTKSPILDKVQLKKDSGNSAIKTDGDILKYTYSSYYSVKEGETLYFIVGNQAWTNGWESFISWNPIVEYLAYQPEYSEITYDRNGASFKVTNDPGITADDIWVFYGDKEERVTNFSNKDGYITFDFINKLKGGISYDIVIDKSVAVSGVNMAVGNNYEGLTVDAANNTFEAHRKTDNYENDTIWAAYWRAWDNGENALMTNGINGNDAKGDHTWDDNVPGLDIQGKNAWVGHVRTINTNIWNDTNYVPFVGDKLMCCGSGSADTGVQPADMHYTVAKGFTAPYSGTVKLTQNNLLDTEKKNEIWCAGANEENGAKIRITKNTKDNVVFPYTTLDKTNGGVYEFEPIAVYVNKGDILYFEVCGASETYMPKSSSLVHWNPVVTYTDVAIDAAFIDSSGNALTTVANLLATDGAQLKMSAFDAAEDVAGTPIIVFCDENGALVKTVIGNMVNLEAVLGSTTVPLGDLTGVNAKSVKVMLWSADGTLTPLTGVFGELN